MSDSLFKFVFLVGIEIREMACLFVMFWLKMLTKKNIILGVIY
jgi:hypothetical protein